MIILKTKENLKRFFSCRSDTSATYILEIKLTSKLYSKDFNHKLQNMYLALYFTSCHLTFIKFSRNSLYLISNSSPYKGSTQILLVPDFINIHDKNSFICNKEQRSSQHSLEHLIWRFLLKAVNYIHKKFYLRCLTRF